MSTQVRSVTLTLDAVTAEALRDLLAASLSDLSYEIANTDNPRYKKTLRAKDTALRAALELLESAVDIAGGAPPEE
jgi:hypothetical protein